MKQGRIDRIIKESVKKMIKEDAVQKDLSELREIYMAALQLERLIERTAFENSPMIASVNDILKYCVNQKVRLTRQGKPM